MITKLPVGARVTVRGATTELDPGSYGPPPSVETGRVALSAALTATVEFDDGTCIAGISWAVIEPDDR